MSLLIQKFGGTSVGSIDKINYVAKKIKTAHEFGNKIVVVISAMAGETDRLDALAHQVTEDPDPKELDVLLATGEQVSIALLSIALKKLGCCVHSYTGFQAKIRTDSVYNKARIKSIDKEKIISDLNRGVIIVIAGFQGIDENNNITTLGRGGSDTTAVALAAALKADECQIYTDVDGVYTSDPRIVSDARRMEQITFKELLELSSLGAKVMQIRAVELAGRYNVPVRVLSTFENGVGTLISYEDKAMEYQVISGIAFSKDEARIIIRELPNLPGVISGILEKLSNASIEIDMIIQNLLSANTIDFAFTINRRYLKQVVGIVRNIISKFGILDIVTNDRIAKVSLVGIGLRSNTSIISKIFNVLEEKGVNIQAISTSEIKVSVLVDEKELELVVNALHTAFELFKEPMIGKIDSRRERVSNMESALP